ncbi:hypothetical protein M9H77_01988 [Catharanthus roseus]|uniref:Uncharacterized protein n=1 Tax=Catharanthus roseus TaxID=4058 RepID=A0ACC0C749_CATRO|nr:hypothetical protein M9H77_01988 [Catharanthus roseus]
MRQFARAQHIPDACDTRLDLHRIQLRGNDHTYWATQHASYVEVWHQCRLHVRDGPALAVKVLSYPNDKYIRWYRGITQVYIENPANCDTRSVEYQPAWVDRRMMEVDDMASVVIREPPSSPLHIAVFVHGIYWQYVGLHSITTQYSTDISSTTVASPPPGACTRPRCLWS